MVWGMHGYGLNSYGLGYAWMWTEFIWFGACMDVDWIHMVWGMHGYGLNSYGLGHVWLWTEFIWFGAGTRCGLMW